MSRLQKQSLLVALGVSLVLTSVLLLLQQQRPPVSHRATLVEALGAIRLSSGRIVGLRYAPHLASPGSVELASSRRHKLARLAVSLTRTSDPSSLMDLALIKLVAGRTAQSRELATRAVQLSSHDPRALSDLAAIYLADPKSQPQSLDLVRALASADQALRLMPALPEALFNRALACERLFLETCAHRDWLAISRNAHDSGWREEAFRHLSQPVSPAPARTITEALDRAARENSGHLGELVRSDRATARKFVEDGLLGVWASEASSNNSLAAGKTIDAARRIAQALSAATSDPFLRDTVAVLASASPDSAQSHHLQEGHSAFAHGRAAYGSGDYRLATTTLALAVRELGAGRSPFTLRARFWLACAEHYRGQRRSALENLNMLQSQARHAGYRALLGDILWMQGLVSLEEADLGRALHFYHGALSVFSELPELASQAGVENLIAEALDYTGEQDSAWRYRLSALAHGKDTGDLLRRYQLEAIAAGAAFAQGYPGVSLYFQGEAVDAAERLGNPVALAHALVARSRYESHMEIPAGALTDAQRARKVSALIGSKEARDRVLAAAMEAQAEMLPAAQRVALLSDALELSKSSGGDNRSLTLLQARARTFRTLGRPLLAAHDLERGIELIEAWRSSTMDLDQRIAFLQKTREVFDELVTLESEQLHDSTAALSFLEQERARTLADGLESRLGGPATSSRGRRATSTRRLEEVASSLPQDTTLVVCTIIERRILIWAIDRRGLRLAFGEDVTPQLDHAIEILRQGPHSTAQNQDFATASAQVYGALISPFRDLTVPGGNLVFDVDDRLQSLPFSALRDPRSGRYLVQDYAISVTPAAGILVDAQRAAASLPLGRRAQLLAVGDPAFDRSRVPALGALPEARREAEAISSLYPRADCLVGAAATPEAFLRAATHATVIHFAGHALADHVVPANSRLILAPGADPSAGGVLYAGDVAALRLVRTRLVFLSACESAAGTSRGPEGIESMARAFLAAGVPGVVGGLWAVDDQASKDLLILFHRRLLAGESPARALRYAQVATLNGCKPSCADLFAWAAYQLTGI